MRVLHMPGTALPWSIGGTETLSHTLARALKQRGVDSFFALHQHKHHNEPLGLHTYDGLPYHVLPPPEGISVLSSYRRNEPLGPSFSQLLHTLKPDLVHYHCFSDDVHVGHFKEVRKHNIPSVFSFHSPGQLCSQRSLLRNGTVPCDGTLHVHRCTSCRLQNAHIPSFIAETLTYISASHTPYSNRILSSKYKTHLFIESFKEACFYIDAFHTMSDWSREVLLRNAVPSHHIHLCKQGIGFTPSEESASRTFMHPLQCYFSGRCDEVKGLHIIIQALQMLPKELPLQFHWYGPYENHSYGETLFAQLQQDPRCHIHGPLPHSTLLQHIQNHHLAIVPSTWLETGPLTVLEALAYKTPVIGSNLGGIAETIQHNVNGWLFEPGNAAQLAALLKHLCIHINDVHTASQNIRPVRSMQEMASEIHALYKHVLASKRQCTEKAS